MIKESYLMKDTFEIKSFVFFRYCIIEYRYSMIREKKELHCYFWMGLINVNSQLIKTNQKPKKPCLGSNGEGSYVPQRVVLKISCTDIRKIEQCLTHSNRSVLLFTANVETYQSVTMHSLLIKSSDILRLPTVCLQPQLRLPLHDLFDLSVYPLSLCSGHFFSFLLLFLLRYS